MVTLVRPSVRNRGGPFQGKQRGWLRTSWEPGNITTRMGFNNGECNRSVRKLWL